MVFSPTFSSVGLSGLRTSIGKGEYSLEPLVLLPSWPYQSYPQAYAYPSLLRASECQYPALTCMAFSPLLSSVGLPGSRMRTGTYEFVFVLLPSWPLLLFPQAYAYPSLPTASECRPPALTCT